MELVPQIINDKDTPAECAQYDAKYPPDHMGVTHWPLEQWAEEYNHDGTVSAVLAWIEGRGRPP